MIKNVKSLLALASDRRGVTALEYAMIAGLVVAVVSIGVTALGTNLGARIGVVSTTVSSVGSVAN